MIPAAARAMRSRPADNICRAALYSVPGICRCPRCAPAIQTPGAPVGDPTPGHTAAAPSHCSLAQQGRDAGGGIFGADV